jgi:hypothetical protein
MMMMTMTLTGSNFLLTVAMMMMLTMTLTGSNFALTLEMKYLTGLTIYDYKDEDFHRTDHPYLPYLSPYHTHLT